MPRPRYPSDDARAAERRAAGGVRIGYSVRNPDPKWPGHAAVFEDAEKRGIWVGLLLVAGQAFAGRTDDVVTLSRADLVWVTGESRRDRAVAKLGTVCGLMGYSIRQHGDLGLTVHVKNLSENQGWTPPYRRSAPPKTPPSESEGDSYQDSEGGEETPPPERLPIEALQSLQTWAATERPDLQQYVPQLVATCLDHFRGTGERRVDWISTCRAWIGREKAPVHRSNGHARSDPDDPAAEARERLRRKYAARPATDHER